MRVAANREDTARGRASIVSLVSLEFDERPAAGDPEGLLLLHHGRDASKLSGSG